MLVTFTQVLDKMHCYTHESKTQYTFQSTAVNPEYVIRTEPAGLYKRYLLEGKLPEGTSPNAEFTKIHLQSQKSIVVVGNQSVINEHLARGQKKKVLLG